MVEMSGWITPNDMLLVKISTWSGRFTVYHNGVLMGKGGKMGLMSFMVAGKRVEVESVMASPSYMRVTVRVDGSKMTLV